jgi:hypothetical protein
MLLTYEEKELTDALVQSLKAKYENTPQKMTLDERFLLMVSATAQYLADWDKCDQLKAEFRADVTKRLDALDAFAVKIKNVKGLPPIIGDTWSELMPYQLEDLVQDLGMMDLLGRVYAVRHRIYTDARMASL